MDVVTSTGFPTFWGFDGMPYFILRWWTDVIVQAKTSAGGGFAGSSGSGLLSTSWKCCTQRAACACSVLRLLPSLSLTGTD